MSLETEKKEISKTKSSISTRVDVLNKRNEIYEFISKARQRLRKFLVKKIDHSNWDLKSTVVEELYKIFRRESKKVLKNINFCQEKITIKRDDFIKVSKDFIKNFKANKEGDLQIKLSNIKVEQEKEVNKLLDKFDKLTNEKNELLKKKDLHGKAVKSKSHDTQKQLQSEESLSIDYATQQIKVLINEHDKFVEEDIIPKVEQLTKEAEKIRKQIKDIESKALEDTYKISEENKNTLIREFTKIANMEKEVIIKCLTFNDFLEDTRYFVEDQNKKYVLLLKSKKIIKNNAANDMRKDINALYSSIADSEKEFDKVNLSFAKTSNRIDNKNLSSKLLDNVRTNAITASDNSAKLLEGSLGALEAKNGEE